MPVWPDFISPADLCPGDVALDTDRLPPDLRLHVVTGADDPCFEIGYRWLRDEFETRGEIETRDVLINRLAWNPARRVGDCALLYRMMLLFSGDTCVAVRDHTAIHLAGFDAIVVHLSHVLVAPERRGGGLSALLRALPTRTARECAAAIGRPGLPVTLFAEMDRFDPSSPASIARCRSYEKAGFLKVEPRIGYHQPDFRSPAAIDAAGGPRDVPLDLNLLRHGREAHPRLPAAELHATVRAVYEMYAVGIRPADMRACFAWLEKLRRAPDADYALMLPTRAAAP